MPRNCLLSSDLMINIVFVFSPSQFTALANPAVKDFNVYPWKWKKPWHFSITNNYKIMQKFHELVRRFSDKPSRCLLFLFGKANIVHRVLKQVDRRIVFPRMARVFCFPAIDTGVLVSSVLSVWLHSFRFELWLVGCFGCVFVVKSNSVTYDGDKKIFLTS